MKKILFSLTLIFISLGSWAQINSIPYSESFDNYGVSSIFNYVYPPNWTLYSNFSPYENPNISSQYSYSSPASLYIVQGGRACLPLINYSYPIDSLRIKFKVLSAAPNSRIRVSLSNNTNNPEFYNTIKTITPSVLNTWQEYEVWFDSCENFGQYIIFSTATTNGYERLYIDDVEVSIIPTCIRPTNLSVSNISSNSATIGFTQQDNETQWKIQYKPSLDTSWANATTIINVTTNPYTITGLTNSTAYDLRIRAVCSSTDQSDWTNTRFHTNISTLPFYDSFDNYGTGANVIPYGWSSIFDNATGVTAINTYNYSPPGALYLGSDSSHHSYAISPIFDSSILLNNVQAKFKFLIGSANSKLFVGVMSDPNDTSTFVQIAEISSNYLIRWEEQEILFNSYTGNGKYIAFCTNNSSRILIDDLEISNIPTCIRPTNITTTNISATTATISFTPRNNETQWKAQYKPASDISWTNATTISNITTNPYTITGLTSATAYNLRIKAVCSLTDESQWKDFSFFTAISSLPWGDSFDSYGTGFDVFPYTCWTRIPNATSNACIDYISYSSPGALNFRSDTNTYNYVISPKIDNSIPINTLRAKFKLRTTYPTNKLIVGVISDPNDTSSFVQIEEIVLNEINTWKDCEVFFNSYNGSGQYIAFNSTDNGQNYVYIDNFEISNLPSCVRPTHINISNITPTSAKVAWYANNNATNWEIEYKPYSDSSWANAVRVSNITTNPFTLTNLPPSTVFSLRIRTICSATDSSDWTYYEHPIHGENLDFSYGNFVNWKAYYATNTSTASSKQFSNWTQTIGDTNDFISNVVFLNINSDTTANDNNILSLKTIPSGYKRSVKINNDDYYASLASKLTYDIDVDYSNYSLTLNYAIVFSNYNFNGFTGPNFSIEVLNLVDSNGVYVENGRALPNAYYDTVGVLSPSGWNSYGTTTTYNWKPWSEIKLDLSSKVGEKVRVKITTSKPRNSYYKAYSYFAGKTEGFEEGACYPPLSVNIDTVGSTYANISFNKNFPTDSNWVIQYREIGDSVWNYINFDTNNYHLSNLSPNANYEAFIQTLCTDSTYSDSSRVFNFSTPNLYIDSTFNNKTAYLCGKYFYDDGREDNYHSNNTNYTFTICPTRKTNESFSVKRTSVNFEEFSLGQGDVLRAYSGRSTNPQTQLSIGNTIDFTGNFLANKSLTANLSDTSGCITFNFITDPADSSSGFKAYVDCFDRCQRVIADLDTFFVKYDTLGNTSTHLIKTITDSVYSTSNNSWTYNTYKSVDFCEGDLIALIAKPQFPDNNSLYNQSANNCIYYWNFGDGYYDTIHYNNMVGHIWTEPKGYELELSILDTNFSYLNDIGCKSNNSINTHIRISTNPIKTVNPLPDMCSGQTFLLNIGYNPNASIVLDSIKFTKQLIVTFDSTVFIPDGPNCNTTGIPCYESSINFDQFNNGTIITSANDILSCCINIEHSFFGDISIFLECPNGQTSTLKVFPGGGGTFLGVPYGGANHGTYDSTNPCTSPPNIPGKGWWYCFSNYRTDTTNRKLNNCPIVSVSDSSVLSYANCTTCDSTHRNDSSNYYIPDIGFTSLIGCPKNGEWKVRICDQWGIDNGFVFGWNVEFNDIRIENCEYQVPIDTVIWNGPFTHNQTPTTTLVSPPLTDGGNYRYNVEIVDDFGCTWDTATYLNVVQTPIVNLGGDTSNCEQFSVMLNAGNIGATRYLWLPTGDTTQSILAQSFSSPDSSITYIAQVTRYNGSIYCYGNDSINLFVTPTPNTPTDLTVQARPTYLEIAWSGNGTSYEIYRNDTLIAISTQPIYFDSNVIDGTNYCYKVKALIENCESEFSNVTCRTYTGLENIINNDLSVIIYPNPTNDKTRLEIKGLKSNADVILYDIYGRAIKTYKLNANQNELEIDVKEFAKGVYNVKVINSNYNITKKLIVK